MVFYTYIAQEGRALKSRKCQQKKEEGKKEEKRQKEKLNQNQSIKDLPLISCVTAGRFLTSDFSHL